MYSMYRKDRNTHGGEVMLLLHRDFSHMPVMELENNSESVWVKIIPFLSGASDLGLHCSHRKCFP